MLCTRVFNLFLSSDEEIFWETDTLLLNGIITRFLPAIEISDVNLGPFVEIGSFTANHAKGIKKKAKLIIEKIKVGYK